MGAAPAYGPVVWDAWGMELQGGETSNSSSRPLSLSGATGVAVLLLHGFTGSPVVWRPLAEHIHAVTGATVEVPLLPGHGTSPEDMARTAWEDWTGAGRDAACRLAAGHERLVVCGLSMGGALALDVSANSAEVDHTVLVNPAVFVDSPAASLARWVRYAVPFVPGIGGDIAMPGKSEFAYARTPLAAVAQLYRGVKDVRAELWKVQSPVDLLISATDNVVGPRSSRFLRAHLPHPPHITVLRRSLHVATLDYDADLIANVICRAAVSPGADAMSTGRHE